MATVAALLFFTAPIGWGVALAIGVTIAAASYGSGQNARELYQEFGNGDLARTSGASQACSAVFGEKKTTSVRKRLLSYNLSSVL
jgi:hypothetical protein